MLSSKELIERAAISRSTLNNYIALGLLPKPVVSPASRKDGRAPRIGYFPPAVLDTIKRIRRLKQKGLSMSEIVARICGATASAVSGRDESASRERGEEAAAQSAQANVPARIVATGPALRSIADFRYPAYLVNNRFEVEWANRAAERDIFGLRQGLPSELTERNLFGYVSRGDDRPVANGEHMLRCHMAIAKTRLSKAALFSDERGGDIQTAGQLAELYEGVEAIEPRPLFHAEVELAIGHAGRRSYNLFAAFFREGVLFAYVPVSEPSDGLIDFLSRRELAIRDLLGRRRPYLTPLTVLVADIQDAPRICAELPAEEYFELVNHVQCASPSLLRKYHGVNGRHVGDGMVYYFFPQPDCNYIMNALTCAVEVTKIMRDVSGKWQARKNWLNDLHLNIGIDEGEEWFGSYRTPTHLEFTAIGETVSRCACLSSFARDGSVWATKNMLGKLPPDARQRVRYGIRRQTETGETVVMEQNFSRVCNLIDLADSHQKMFRDIAGLPVTEILELDRGNTNGQW